MDKYTTFRPDTVAEPVKWRGLPVSFYPTDYYLRRKNIRMLRTNHTRLLVLFCFLLGLQYATGQQVYYKKFTSSDNLPSSVLYRAFSDSRGFIWVSSDAGIARYDGMDFLNFTARQGMPDNEVFDLCEDSAGSIWFTTLRGDLGFIREGRVYTTPVHDYLGKGQLQGIFFDHENNLWLSTKKGDIYKTRDGQLLNHWSIEKTRPQYMLEDFQGGIWFSTYNTRFIYRIDGDSIRPVELAGEHEAHYYSARPTLLRNGNILFYGRHFWGIFNVTTGKAEIISRPEEFLERIIMCAMEDESGNIWIGTSKGVVIYGHDGQGHYTSVRGILDEERITCMTVDFEGNYWLSTLSGGLYYLPGNPLSVHSYQLEGNSNNTSVVLRDVDGRVWVGNDEGNIFVVNQGRLEKFFHGEESAGLGRITCGTVMRNGTLCFGKDNELLMVDRGKVKRNTRLSSIKSLAEGDSNTLWVGTHAQLVKVDGKNPEHTEVVAKGRITAICVVQDRVYYANDDGLNYYEKGKSTLYLPSSVFAGQRISRIVKHNQQSLLWISTLGNGIFGVEPGNGIVYHISTQTGLTNDICNTIHLDSAGNVWVATKRGINKISIRENGWEQVLLVNHENGLIADEVNDIDISGDQLWVATSMGVSHFVESSVNYLPVPPPVYVERVVDDGKELPLQKSYEIPYNRGHIQIELVGLSFMSEGKLRYKYKMDGLDSNWVENVSPVINYPTLSPGQYHFQAKAINSRGEESAVAAELFIVVSPAYWQTPWFKVFIGFIIFLILISSIVVRIKVIKKQEEEKTRLNKMLGELELTALKAQMNPHFIFNSLGSIQNLINRDKKIEANIYLSKFAKLLRMTLDHSDKREVSLADETVMLELYLGLEALRFVNKFEYRIEVDTEIDTYSVKIPPMIVQPFIENAIKHGLLPKKADALLVIRFSLLEDQTLYCMVEDNGIGRVQREKLKEKSTSGHISKGIKITKNRLELVNQLRSRPAEIRITDLYKDNGEGAGTRIEIFIPVE